MYSEKRPACRQAGQSLMELVVVIAVMVIVIGALTFATIASLRNAQFAKNQAQATKLAQEGLEWVRTGRDRNQAINGGLGNVTSWNGDAAGVAVWSYQINGNCGTPALSTYCFFNITNQGILNYAGVSGTIPSGAEPIPPFKRAIIISDDAAFAKQKTVTAIVTWTDFSGEHKSQLTTILRRI